MEHREQGLGVVKQGKWSNLAGAQGVGDKVRRLLEIFMSS